MNGVVVKYMIDNPDQENIVLGSSMGFRIISSILSMFSVCMIVLILNPNDSTKLVLVLLQSFQLSFKAVQILDSWFQRHLKFSYDVGKILLKNSYHFIISGIMVAIYTQMDRIMIGQMMGDLDVGLYTTATAICSMWIFLPTSIIISFQPTIMEIKRKGNEADYLYRLKQLYSLIIWLCFGVSAVVAICGRMIIYLLYGQAYLGAINVLRIIIWVETFSMIGTARGIWILCENKNKYVKYYLGIGAVLNLMLNIIMIPKFGISGAAIATLITQVMTSVFAPLLFKETRSFTKLVIDSFLFKW